MLEAEQRLLDEFNNISRGALLRLQWLDAATIRNADVSRLPLRNDYVETRRATVGSFVCLQRGRSQGAWHVMLEMDKMDDAGSMLRSIPLCLVYKVIAPSLKFPEALYKVARRGIDPLVERVFRLRNGGIKVLD
jgi:hypothetical protein